MFLIKKIIYLRQLLSLRQIYYTQSYQQKERQHGFFTQHTYVVWKTQIMCLLNIGFVKEAVINVKNENDVKA